MSSLYVVVDRVEVDSSSIVSTYYTRIRRNKVFYNFRILYNLYITKFLRLRYLRFAFSRRDFLKNAFLRLRNRRKTIYADRRNGFLRLQNEV